MRAMAEEATYRIVRACRVCGSSGLDVFLSFGSTPLANAFVHPERATEIERRYPLETMRCERCGLVQLTVVVRPEVMFTNYLYESSASDPMVAHFAAYADEVVSRFVPHGSLVVEIGSNDGVLLAPLAARGARVVGVEPATNLARVANSAGYETWNEFFDADVARRIAAVHGKAKAVLGNNVLAHIDDLAGSLAGLDELLDDDGVFVFEVPYLLDLLESVEYDTIYHEHLSYFHLAPLRKLFEGIGMEFFDMRRLPIHGGSIRVFACRAGQRERSREAGRTLSRESAARLDLNATYVGFTERVAASRAALRQMLASFKTEGRRIAGVGATAKGNTLLNFCEIGADTLDFIADSTPRKVGMLTPGMHIPIRDEGSISRIRPDYTLLLAWNFADAIVRKHSGYLAAGGRFIHPIPLARLYPSA